MALFHSLPKSQFPASGGAVPGDLYYAVDTAELFVCAEGFLFPVAGILSGGMQLGPPGPQGPPGPPGVSINEEPHAIDLLAGERT